MLELVESGCFHFGPFCLEIPRRRLLLRGEALVLSARAFDILAVLVRRAGSVVNKADLLALVWGGRTVEDSSLRVAMSELRKALVDGQAGARFIATVSGRGYCFVAPVARAGAATSSHGETNGDCHNVPARMANVIGRDQIITETASNLLDERFVTLVGPGGIGKTTVANCVAHALLGEFSGFVRFVDFTRTSHSADVFEVLARSLNLGGLQSDDLLRALRQKHMLLVLDCCEHVINVVAPFAARLHREAPRVHILATSREAMLVDGEHVKRLRPLECPPQNLVVPVSDLINYSAPRLFLERAASSTDEFELTDDSAKYVADICRKLDGNPLAIAIAATHVGTCGIRPLTEILEKPINLVWEGPRTADLRHRTLRAVIDWSYRLLSDDERRLLCLLSVFEDRFTLQAVATVVLAAELDETAMLVALFGLVNKSMLISTSREGQTKYAMPQSTRVYVQDLLSDLRDGQISKMLRQISNPSQEGSGQIALRPQLG